MRISEVYRSVQGEGPRVGSPTIFVRFAGCNLRCPGWPCDTPHAILPEKFRQEWRDVDVHTLAAEIQKLWSPNTNICFTGGEPFLQKDTHLYNLVMYLQNILGRPYDIEVFTNGTLQFLEWAIDELYFIMDWKLPGSGEDYNNKLRYTNFYRLSEVAGNAVKFTIADRKDFDTAVELYYTLRAYHDVSLIEFYYGVVWGKLDNATLIEWVMHDRLPWRFNMQTHNHIWDRNLRGI